MPRTEDRPLHPISRPGWVLSPLAAEIVAAAYVDEDGVPGWAKMGQTLLPRTFELIVHEINLVDPADPLFEVILMYSVEEGEVHLRMVWSSTDEVPDALAALRKEQPLAEWELLARTMLMTTQAEDIVLAGRSSVDLTTEENALRFQRMGDAVRAAHGASRTRRRDRITPALLQEVAEVYRAAWAAGEAPTWAVAEHFHKSHSTAAKWVGRARQEGHLGSPATGSRGGEES